MFVADVKEAEGQALVAELQAKGATTPESRGATFNCTLVVLWPDGCASIYANVIPRQILTVTEQVTPSCCCQGATGNVNSSGIVDLADLSALVSYLTGSGYILPCYNEANVNGTGIVDLSDLSALISYLTGGGYQLANCP